MPSEVAAALHKAHDKVDEAAVDLASLIFEMKRLADLKESAIAHARTALADLSSALGHMKSAQHAAEVQYLHQEAPDARS